jgi:hypothetical protein
MPLDEGHPARDAIVTRRPRRECKAGAMTSLRRSHGRCFLCATLVASIANISSRGGGE